MIFKAKTHFSIINELSFKRKSKVLKHSNRLRIELYYIKIETE